MAHDATRTAIASIPRTRSGRRWRCPASWRAMVPLLVAAGCSESSLSPPPVNDAAADQARVDAGSTQDQSGRPCTWTAIGWQSFMSECTVKSSADLIVFVDENHPHLVPLSGSLSRRGLSTGKYRSTDFGYSHGDFLRVILSTGSGTLPALFGGALNKTDLRMELTSFVPDVPGEVSRTHGTLDAALDPDTSTVPANARCSIHIDF